MRPLPLTLWALIAAQIDALAPPEQAQPQPQNPLPTAVRKMPPDQGAKFHHEYCAFAEQGHQHPSHFAPLPIPPRPLAARNPNPFIDGRPQQGGNSSIPLPEYYYSPPFLVTHTEQYDASLLRRAAQVLSLLQRRQWACPSGTSGCGSIGYPNSCCTNGETCVEVQDTGLGPVGCCPAGATCAGGVTGCTGGSTACASDIGGGCCISGFVCQGVGCVSSASASTATVTVVPTPANTVATTFTTTSTSIIQDAPTPSTVVVTVIVTISPSQVQPTTSTLTQTVSEPGPTSSQGTGIGTTTDAIGAPFRPTSSSTNGISTYCPTGFYACLASAGGGCCQTGRDCQTTSCPPVPMTTIVNGGGVTIVVPAEGAVATTGSCASGWYMCGSDAGPAPGCCPSGYSCGTASCSVLMDGATATVAKVRPGSSARSLTFNVDLMPWVWIMMGIYLVVL
ncbi:hypothetical protein B0T14DRAFT_299254 [Immersiella caudata]|uniref:GPI anchored protein n=1 Tax=Immersiella caudata TaxID=314043 RepID=A0AA39WF20_9PEZI|nr:hypothetical protein B0T14DRAFT_299254 [Immersiella caudata]